MAKKTIPVLMNLDTGAVVIDYEITTVHRGWDESKSDSRCEVSKREEDNRNRRWPSHRLTIAPIGA